MTLDTVVFDIGGVLVDWQPHLVWESELGENGARAFLERIKFETLNLACDAGASFAKVATEVADPEDAKRLAQYVPRFTYAVPNKLSETWEVLYALKAAGVALHAITNWSAETWPEGLKAHPELGTVFKTTVVSGEIGVIKPSTEIFRIFCDRAAVAPERCVFVDDGLHNCFGAKAAGMDAIHFQGATRLRTSLEQRGLL